MKKIEKENTIKIVSSRSISRIGDILFDFANNAFLATINSGSLYFVGIYQLLESMMRIIFNLFGVVVADRFRRKKLLS